MAASGLMEAERRVENQQQILAELNAIKTAHMAGDVEGAMRRYQGLLAAYPTFADVLHPLGIAFQQLGRHKDAVEAIGHWLRVSPNDADALLNLANSLLALQRGAEAVNICERAVALRPDFAGGHAALGLAWQQAGNPVRSETAYRRALEMQPDSPECLFNFANLLADNDRRQEAIDFYRRALAVRADLPEVHVNLANNLVRLNRIEEGIVHFNQALRLRPGMPAALLSLGNALFEQSGDLEAARRCFDAVVAQDPANRDGLNNLTSIAMEKGDLRQGEIHARAMLARHSDGLTHTTAAGLFMSMGQWEEGWQHFEWRWLRPSLPVPLRDFGKPEWQGEDISDKTVLIHHEQGLGDSIQFVRFVAQMATRARHVVLEVPQNLLALYGHSIKDATLVAFGEMLPPFDVQVPIMSLARLLGVTVDTVPAPIPYLAADPDRVAAWRDRLPQGGLRIGIVWQGKPGVGVDRGRSYALEQLAPVARIPGVTLISLQKGYGLDQLENLPPGMQVTTLGPDFDEGPDAFLDTAAVMQHLDLIISSDTSVAHLAGALGRPVWVPLKFAPDWRWMRERGDSPWYPQTMRLFRQTRPRDWVGVFQGIAAEVTALRDGDKTRLAPPPPPPRQPLAAFPPVPTPPLPLIRPPALAQLTGLSVAVTTEVRETQTRYGTLRYPTSDNVVGRSLEAYGEWMEREYDYSACASLPGDVAIEVGPCLGGHAIELSRSIKVHLFEPDEAQRELLEWNIDHNDHGSVTVHPEDGSNIDALALPELGLIKVSTGGMALPVMQGARHTIMTCRPCLILRHQPGDADEGALLELAAALNYHVWERWLPLYQKDNFKKNSMNLFPNIGVGCLIGVPAERDALLVGFQRKV